jgi:hypothetical protein
MKHSSPHPKAAPQQPGMIVDQARTIVKETFI